MTWLRKAVRIAGLSAATLLLVSLCEPAAGARTSQMVDRTGAPLTVVTEDVGVGFSESVAKAPAMHEGVTLVANDVVDLMWDPSAYRGPGYFVRWELRRGTAPNPTTVIASGTGTLTSFHRDTGLASGTTYHYELVVVRCPGQCPPDAETLHTQFTDSVTAGYLEGVVHRDLTLKGGTYEISPAGGVGSGYSVPVVNGARLKMGSGTTVKTGGRAGIRVRGGRLEIDGTSFENVSLDFGDYYDESVKGEGWVKNATLKSGSITLYGETSATIDKCMGDFFINVDFKADATVSRNDLKGSIEVRRNATATIEWNTIEHGKILVSGYGAAAGSQKAFALITNNVISNTAKTWGIDVWDGAQARVTDNEIKWNDFHGTESSVVLSVADKGSKLIAERNEIVGKVFANWGAEIELRENLLDGGGSAITIGCGLCGSQTQATGVIEHNTIQNAWGLELWPGSTQLAIRQNCIRGNNPGLTWMPAQGETLDVRDNWWNHVDGPYHKTLNPGGNGDAITLLSGGGTLLISPWSTNGSLCLAAPPPPVPVDLKGRVYVPGSKYGLSRVPVTLLRGGRVLDRTVADIDGFYAFNRVPITNSLVISVVLEYAKTTPPVFRIVYQAEGGPVVYAVTRPFSTVSGPDFVKDIRFADVADMGPSPPIPANRRADLGMMYYHTHQAWRLADEVLGQGLDFQLPVDIVGYSANRTSWLGPYSTGWNPGRDPHIRIKSADSPKNSLDRPDNREWHEFGHHVHADTCGNLMPGNNLPHPGDVNHRGYRNPSTTDSFVEGFAEFYSVLVAALVEHDPWPQLYDSSATLFGKDVEINDLAWTTEEFAVAGLLLDLVDPEDMRDATRMNGTTYADCVEMRLEELWTILETDWDDVVPRGPAATADGYTYLSDVKHLYDILKINRIGSDHSRGRELDDLDELFIAHGFFADIQPPYRAYTGGEEPGRAADVARPDRRNYPGIPGSAIAFNAVNAETGLPLDVGTFTLDARFAPPFQHYNYSVTGRSVTSGSLPYIGPDPQYDMEAIIRAWSPGFVSAEALTVTNDFYWTQMATEPTDHFMEHTFEMTPAETVYLPIVRVAQGVPTLRGAGAASFPWGWRAEGALRCVPEGPTPTPGPSPTPSFPIVESIEPSSTTVGTEVEVIIYGYFFEAGASPYVGYTLLTDVEYLGPEISPPHRWRIQATVPGSLESGVYDVTVVNPDGLSGVLTDGFTVSDAEPPPGPETVTIFQDGFEGDFPGDWERIPTEDEYLWGKRDCRASAGSYSAWAVGGGTIGYTLDCGSNYTDDVETWMVYGPFSLANASAAELTFQMWLNTEQDYDGLSWTASIDGNQFYGYVSSGNTGGWTSKTLDLTAVPTLGDLTGEEEVWIGLIFSSDGSINQPEGAYVDDVVLTKTTSPPGASGEVPSETREPGVIRTRRPSP